MKFLVFLGERCFEFQFFVVLTRICLRNTRLIVRYVFSDSSSSSRSGSSASEVILPCFLGDVEPYSFRTVKVGLPREGMKRTRGGGERGGEKVFTTASYTLECDGKEPLGPYSFACAYISRVGVLLPLESEGQHARFRFGRKLRAIASEGSGLLLVHARIEDVLQRKLASLRRGSTCGELVWRRKKSRQFTRETRLKNGIYDCAFAYVRERLGIMSKVCNTFMFRANVVPEADDNNRWIGDLLACLSRSVCSSEEKVLPIISPTRNVLVRNDPIVKLRCSSFWILSFESLRQMWRSTLRLPTHLRNVVIFCWEASTTRNEICTNLLGEPNFVSTLEEGMNVLLFFPNFDRADSSPLDEHMFLRTHTRDIHVFRATSRMHANRIERHSRTFAEYVEEMTFDSHIQKRSSHIVVV